jgi:hypothetical protein
MAVGEGTVLTVGIPVGRDSGERSWLTLQPSENHERMGGWSEGRSPVLFGFSDWCGLGFKGLACLQKGSTCLLGLIRFLRFNNVYYIFEDEPLDLLFWQDINGTHPT